MQEIIEAPHPTKTIRLDYIDCLRGFAALYVVCFHAVLVPEPHLILPAWLDRFLMSGDTGVTLFFVISAFTLCLTLDGKQHRPHSTHNFYIRRIFRILPLYYVWLLGMVVFSLGWQQFLIERKALILYTTFTYNFFPHYQEGLVWASWTLGVEMLFYAAFPFIFRLVNSLKDSLVFLLFSLGIAFIHWEILGRTAFGGMLLVHGYKVYLSIFNQLPVFAIGMVTYFIYKKLKITYLTQATKRTVFALGIVSFFIFVYARASIHPFLFPYSMAVVYSVIFLGFSFFPTNLFVNKYGVFLGVISYSLYLNHPHLLWALSPAYQYIYQLDTWNSVRYLLCMLLTIPLLTVISYITFRFIEEPFIKRSNLFLKK